MKKLLHKIKRFLIPDPYQDGIDHIRENWEWIGPVREKFLQDLKVVEGLAGGGKFEDGLREGIRLMEFEENYDPMDPCQNADWAAMKYGDQG